MICIKNQILITVSYVVEAEIDDFFHNQEVKKNLKKRFPKKAKIAENLYAKRQHLSHIIIDYPNANLMKCPICKCFITDSTKPNYVYTIQKAVELEGVTMCSSCAWELDFDVKNGRTIESILEDFK